MIFKRALRGDALHLDNKAMFRRAIELNDMNVMTHRPFRVKSRENTSWTYPVKLSHFTLPVTRQLSKRWNEVESLVADPGLLTMRLSAFDATYLDSVGRHPEPMLLRWN